MVPASMSLLGIVYCSKDELSWQAHVDVVVSAGREQHCQDGYALAKSWTLFLSWQAHKLQPSPGIHIINFGHLTFFLDPNCHQIAYLTALPIEQGRLPGRPFRATFAGAPFAIHKLWAMSSLVCLIALISVTSGPNFLACSNMLRGAAQGPEVCLPLSHCLAAEGSSDMNTIPSS